MAGHRAGGARGAARQPGRAARAAAACQRAQPVGPAATCLCLAPDRRACGVSGRQLAAKAGPAAARICVIPKAELHCHLEGSIPPALARELAARNGAGRSGRPDRRSRPLCVEGLPELPRHLRPRLRDPAHAARLRRRHLFLSGQRRAARARSMSRCSARPSGRRRWASPTTPGSRRSKAASTAPGATSASRAASSSSASAISGPTGRSPWRRPWWPSRIPMSWASAWAATRRSSRPPTSRRPIGWPTTRASAAPSMPARCWGRKACGRPSTTCR